MCNKTNYKTGNVRIDKCLINCIFTLRTKLTNIGTVSSCCGHGKYKTTIIVKDQNNTIWDLLSGIVISRKKRFYKKDDQGYYYIPETLEKK